MIATIDNHSHSATRQNLPISSLLLRGAVKNNDPFNPYPYRNALKRLTMESMEEGIFPEEKGGTHDNISLELWKFVAEISTYQC